jgi:hypothetical protein
MLLKVLQRLHDIIDEVVHLHSGRNPGVAVEHDFCIGVWEAQTDGSGLVPP